MTKKPKLYLIDGSSYIFRAFFGIRQFLSNSKGLPTNALYGFTNMLIKVVRDEKPDYLAMVFDSKAKTFRHKKYPKYKANREVPPEDLAQQFPYFEPLVDAFDIVSLKQDGFEADDIIGTLSLIGKNKGLDVVIVSGDKDMMQLIDDQISMLDTMKNKQIRQEEVVEKFGVPPEKVIEVMGLMGDSSDHIPGVKGVGPKTATDLIQKYGSIQNLYDHVDEIEKKKLKEKLNQDRENAFLSRELVTIKTDMDLNVKIENLRRKEPNPDKLRKIFSDLEFNSLLNDLGPEDASSVTQQNDRPSFECVLDNKTLDFWINKLKKTGEFALDLETTSKHPMKAQMVGISFSNKDHEACYVPVDHRYMGAPKQLSKKETLKKLQPILENPKLKKYGHNIKYDLIVLENEGIRLKGIEFDSMIASYVLDPGKRNHNMDDLALQYLGRKTISYSEVAGKGAKEIGFDEVEVERATDYAAEDSEVTWLLSKKFQGMLEDEASKLYHTLELPLIQVLAEMEKTGVLLDKKHLAKLSQKIDKKLKKLEDEIYLLAGAPFNINSPKQLGVVLFEDLKLPVLKKTKTGYSTDVSVLEELSAQHELPEKVLSFRQMAKLKSTYVDSLPNEINPTTGRVHTSYNQTVAATGRLSSSDPNLQNIPIRTDFGKEIRKAFIASPNCLLLSADYSQIELRLLAHLSEDPALIKAFKKDEDIHSRTAAEIFGTGLNSVDEENRRMAKAVNFGIVYGLSAFGLSRQLKISPKEAKIFIDQYFQLYKNVKKFMESTIDSARDNGYTSTMMGRKRYLPDINSKNRMVREAAERIAINSPVQGSAADIIKLAMIRLFEQLQKKKLKSKMILQVHDELVFDVLESEKSDLGKLVEKEMEKVVNLKVPLKVSMDWGSNWNEAH